MTTASPPAPSPAKPLWLRRPERQQHVALALSVIGSGIDVVRITLDQAGPMVAIGAVLTLGGAFIARRWGWAGLGVALGGTAIALAGGWDPIVQYSVVAFTLFGLTLRGFPAVRVVGLAAGALAVMFVTAGLLRHVNPLATDSAAAVVGALATGAIGTALRLQAQYWEALELRAQDAVVRGEIEAERRAAEERLRIARDLHDIVGHNVAVISMNLGAVEVSAGRDQAVLDRSLRASRAAVQAVLAETQQTLRLLRGGGPDDETSTRPVPGLITIPELLASFQEIGLRVTSEIDLRSAANGIDAGVGVIAYRLVQEALTNALQHGTGSASVRVRADDTLVHLEIANPVGALRMPSSGTGYGLLGMTERVLSVGGTVRSERASGAFRVLAELPSSRRNDA